MNKLVLSCALIATAAHAIKVESEVKELVELNVKTPDDWESDDEAIVEVNIDDADAVDVFEYGESTDEEEMEDEDTATQTFIDSMWTDDEYAALTGSLDASGTSDYWTDNDVEPNEFEYELPVDFVETVNFDWRTNKGGSVSDVRESSSGCGASWAFAGVAAIESAFYIINDYSVSLSVQEPIDCNATMDTVGCDAGLLD